MGVGVVVDQSTSDRRIAGSIPTLRLSVFKCP